MKFAVGYQLPQPGKEPFVEVVRDFAEHIAEVYFPWLDMPSGRPPVNGGRAPDLASIHKQLETDLKAFASMGIRLNLLLNASCYGKRAVSRTFANTLVLLIRHLAETVGLGTVTTMSPMIAKLVKTEFPGIRVRASVNMRLGTVRAFEYVADLFDGFTMQREFNRNLDRIRELKSWCDRRGKALRILANSACLAHCAAQTFHDNLVSHESELDPVDCMNDDVSWLCRRYLAEPANRVCVLQNTWIRPEDLHHYEPGVEMMKLATRLHDDPRKVIAAYCAGSFRGNLLDLFEPGHGAILSPLVIDNKRFPDDWFEHSVRCRRSGTSCRRCVEVLNQVLVQAEIPAAEVAQNQA